MKVGAALALMLLSTPAHATVVFIGIGNDSCATAFRPENRMQTGAWILGFWSARNYERRANVGETSDAHGIIAEVELTCSKLPSSPMKYAAIVAYDAMEQDGR